MAKMENYSRTQSLLANFVVMHFVDALLKMVMLQSNTKYDNNNQQDEETQSIVYGKEN